MAVPAQARGQMGEKHMTDQFSPEYHRAVAEGARHHAASKTYSGSFLRPHKPFLAQLIAETGSKTVLDYGCGKGRQYEWVDPADGKTLEAAWEVVVTRYDPCYPPFAAEPEGTFDLVLCTHTISLIPVRDLNRVLHRLFGLANRAVFIAEKIGGRKKGEVADPLNRAIGWPVDRWLGIVEEVADQSPEKVCIFSAREKLKNRTRMTRFERKDGAWLTR